MTTATARERHRAHHTRTRIRSRLLGAPALAAALALGMAVQACRATLPRPPSAPIATSDYVPVPFPPRVPPLEFVPPKPVKGAVWMDGSWVWTGRRYRWRFGSWVLPPPNARYARWVVVRRDDGQLFFAPSTWKDPSGQPLKDVSFRYALGPRARARPRPGAAPPENGDVGGWGRGESHADVEGTVDEGDVGDDEK